MNEQVPTGMPLLYLVMYIAFCRCYVFIGFQTTEKREKKQRNGRISKSRR